MKYEDGGPAFPKQDYMLNNGDILYGYDGMSMRIWLAGKAANGVLANPSDDFYPVDLAKKCLAIADVIIAQDVADMKQARKDAKK